MSTGAVQQAVDLLQQRLAEARAEHGALTSEIQQIEQALTNLGIGTVAPLAKKISAKTATAGGNPKLKGMTVSAATRFLIESERGPWTPAMARDRLVAAGLQKKGVTNAKFTANVRSAFYTLRKTGVAVVADEVEQTTIAAKWLKDSETPAVTGVSVGNTPTNQEGGDSLEEDAETATTQAEHQFFAQLGASIAEVAS